MSVAIVVAVAAGLFMGALLGYLGARCISNWLAARVERRLIVSGCAAVGVVAALPVALFMSFVVGGNLGGGWGEVLSETAGLGAVGVPVGLSVGIAVVAAAGITIGAALGATLGYGVSYLLN